MKPSAHTKKQPTTSIVTRRPYQAALFPMPPAPRADGRIDGEASLRRCGHRMINLYEKLGVLPADVASAAHVDVENDESCMLRIVPYIPRVRHAGVF